MFGIKIIVGNLGRDPEMRFTQTGKAVTTMSVATNRRYTTDNDQKVTETTWYRTSVWGAMAEVCNKYLRKGDLVLIVGRLITDPATGGPRIWTGQDGKPHAQFELNISEIRFLKTQGNGQTTDVTDETLSGQSGEDVPF